MNALPSNVETNYGRKRTHSVVALSRRATLWRKLFMNHPNAAIHNATTTGQLIPGLWIRCRRKMCFNVGSIKVLKLVNLYIEYHYQEGRNAPESSNSAKREDNRWFPSNKQGTRYLRRYKASRDRYHFYIEQKTGKKWMAKKGNSSAVEREPRSYPDRPDSGTMIRPGTAGRFCGAMRNICITINEIGPVCESYGALRWL